MRIVAGSPVETRDEMLQALELGEMPTLNTEHRTIGVGDFFAAGFVSLQIQVMTRRLRYTSNLDEIHLQSRIVAAAQAFVDGDGEAAADALHDVFDCLAEERDHYFSSDPHLIDLTLLTPSTLDKFVDQQLDPILQSSSDADPDQAPIRPTPCNVLINHQVASALAGVDGDRYQTFRRALSDGSIGWAGGDPDPTICLDAVTFNQAELAIKDGHQRATDAIGSPPAVYSRFADATPADLTPTIVSLGYQGMIPLDFSRGSGFGDEAKVMREGGGAEIQALTAKPIDAASDASFLDLGASLGEAIDSGEIATALLVHWPGRSAQALMISNAPPPGPWHSADFGGWTSISRTANAPTTTVRRGPCRPNRHRCSLGKSSSTPPIRFPRQGPPSAIVCDPKPRSVCVA